MKRKKKTKTRKSARSYVLKIRTEPKYKEWPYAILLQEKEVVLMRTPELARRIHFTLNLQEKLFANPKLTVGDIFFNMVDFMNDANRCWTLYRKAER